MAKCLVTGGAGFIGSHIAQGLLEAGHSVRVLDNFCAGFKKNLDGFANDIELIEGDICDEGMTAKAVNGIEVVFHQAALASVPLSIDKPLDSHRACATGTLNMLHQSAKAGVARFIYAASSSAYGDQPTSSKRETDLPMTLSPYAAAKLAGEYYCQAFFHSFGLQTTGIRYFNVFGPRQDPNSPYSAVIPIFVSRILNNQSPIIYGDGQQSRDFCYVKNVVHANLLAAQATNAGGKVINVADGRQTTLLQLLLMLADFFGEKVDPKFEPARSGDVRESLADITLARKLLGYEPKFTLEEGLKATIEYYRGWVKG
jgi:UDP-glucose 4-epimerase